MSVSFALLEETPRCESLTIHEARGRRLRASNASEALLNLFPNLNENDSQRSGVIIFDIIIIMSLCLSLLEISERFR